MQVSRSILADLCRRGLETLVHAPSLWIVAGQRLVERRDRDRG